MEQREVFLSIILLSATLHNIYCERREICSTERFRGKCPEDMILIVESALYGRMALSRCIEVEVGLGCQNDVLYLADRWCSGRQECDVLMPNKELKSANTECRALTSYMQLEYSCVPVNRPDTNKCEDPTRMTVHGSEGYIASLVTSQTGCGSPKAPWLIECPYGQTVDFWLIDFGALDRVGSALGLSCQIILGYITERGLGTNFTICGNHQRKKHLLSSKTNKLEVHLLEKKSDVNTPHFLIRYSIVGCPDLTPPKHAWYKREGNKAVIGCKFNDRIWRLYCNGNTWDGVVGNCSTTEGKQKAQDLSLRFTFSSVILLTCVVCGALLLIIVVVVAGTVYVKKQRINHQLKLRSDYAITTLQPAQYFTIRQPVCSNTIEKAAVEVQQTCESQPLVQICDKTLAVPNAPVDSSLLGSTSGAMIPRDTVKR